ncbi:MAG TPA: dienelactone hydrolase family protein [Candidatus Saccharimonadales bacterium]|nr:dienelactone hydrolase family protein [Candidatus Saccharimonadales bacterium]
MHEETVTLSTPDGPMDAYLARPDGAGPFPAVVVIQEAFGVNGHIRGVARRLAGTGYAALAPEIFHREGRGITIPYTDMPSVMPRLAALTNEGLEQDLRAAFDHLRGRPEVDAARVGLVGFCVGGFVAFLGACRVRPAATVSFYGGGIARPRPNFAIRPVLPEAGGIGAPILCLFGELDQGIPPADVDAIRGQLQAHGVPHEVVVYPGANHAFFCDERPAYHAEAAADAWRRTLGWFGKHLGAKP